VLLGKGLDMDRPTTPLELEIADPRFLRLVAEDAPLERLCDGFGFTEGAVWHPIEQHVSFSDIPASRVWRWCARHGARVLREPSGKANGLTYDRRGRLLMCEHATHRVTMMAGDAITVLAERYRGRALNSPNDIVCAPTGDLYFTDPTYGCEAWLGVERTPEMAARGLYKISGSGALTLVADDFVQPNGLCFSVDAKRLFVNDSVEMHIRVFDLDRNGTPRGGDVWVVTESSSSPDGGPDGMKTDEAGNIWCAGTGGVRVFDPQARYLGKLCTPQFPANFCFGGEDLHDLFVTAGTALYRVRLKQAGIPVF
jgi:gluconolactonase